MISKWAWALPVANAASVFLTTGVPAESKAETQIQAQPQVEATAFTGEYVVNAMAAIDTLNNQWYDVATGIWDTAWWNSANVLTTLAEFALLRLEEANSLNIGGYMQNTFINAQKTQVSTTKSVDTVTGMVASSYCLDNNPSCMPVNKRGLHLSHHTHTSRHTHHARGFDDFLNEFYDDEGWWALANIRTYDATGEQQYLDAAVQIFNDMQTGLGGPCNGGIYWMKDRKYVNAIANELYLSVAASLATRIPLDGRYLQIAQDQWQWFKNSGMINKDNLINDGLTADCRNNGLQTWSYNQGVILGGLVELKKATGDTTLLAEATLIAKAAIAHLSVDGVLVETDKCELKPGNCGRDGQQFKGIFIRNLRYLHEAAPDPQFREFILNNADVLWARNRNDQNMLGVSWNGPFVLATGPSQSAALDVIVAAIAVSE